MQDQIEKYIKQIENDYNRWMSGDGEVATEMREDFVKSIGYKVGRKYIKFDTGGSAHSFIVNTDNDKKFKRGDILKAASYAAPARNFARGNIFNDQDILNVRWTGA